MTKNELICKILELNVKVGINDADNFVNYMTMVLPMMDTSDLEYELEHTEDNTIGLME